MFNKALEKFPKRTAVPWPWACPEPKELRRVPTMDDIIMQGENSEKTKSIHHIDGKNVTCCGDGCPICLCKALEGATWHAPSWGWYAKFLVEFATREANACRQKLHEYGFSEEDVFLPIDSLGDPSESVMGTWWKLWLQQGYGRHGQAATRIITKAIDFSSKRQFTEPLRRRVSDMYGYSSLGVARIAFESYEKDSKKATKSGLSQPVKLRV